MNKYESIFVISALLEDEKIQEIIGKVKNLIEESGQLFKMDEWGKRRLAYEIDDQKEGYYTLVQFTAAPEFPAELERIYKITEGVMKYLILKLDDKVELVAEVKADENADEKAVEKAAEQAEEKATEKEAE